MSEKQLATIDGGMATIINQTDLPDEEVISQFRQYAPEYAAMVKWSESTRVAGSRRGGIADRDKYVAPNSIFSQFQIAQEAAIEDDVVAGVLESTESLAFSKMSFECENLDEEDIWNQIGAEMNLDDLFRQMWRETFIISQFYASVFWGKKTFKVRRKGGKKQFANLIVPLAMNILDPLKVIPVDGGLFGKEKLIYVADPVEAEKIDAILDGKADADPVVAQLISGRYEPRPQELKSFNEIGGIRASGRFYELNPENVWRHTATKPDYKNFADCRMRAVFELLDMKRQLRNMDRAYLLGATNFIVLVKKGSDELPAKQGEVNQLGNQMRQSSRIPVIVTDHRTEIEIITPDVDMTLDKERYDVLDERIVSNLFKSFSPSETDPIKLARVVARGMESARHMIMRDFEKFVIKKIVEKNSQFKDEPNLVFHPKRIALDFDNHIATFLQDARDRGDISRQTLLEQLDISQEDEARKRIREKDLGWDDVFEQTNVPFSGQAGLDNGGSSNDSKVVDVKSAGRRGGGNNNGGGFNRNSTQPNSDPVRPSNRTIRKGKKS